MTSKSQSVNFSRTRARDIRVNQEMNTGSKIINPISREEFIASVKRIINDLQIVSDKHPDIGDAVSELRSLLREIQKPKPQPTVIKRFLTSAKGLLVDASETVTAVVTISTGITTLIGAIKLIFGA